MQTDLLAALNKTALQTGVLLQRQNAALAETWMRAVTDAATSTKGVRAPVSSGQTRQSSTGDQRWADTEVQATSPDVPQTQTTEANVGPPVQQAHPQEQSLETAHESTGGPVAATASGRETEGFEGLDSDSDIGQLETLGPMAEERLRSADVHTIEQLARARTKELAAETGLHPRRIRVWVFRARRIGDW